MGRGQAEKAHVWCDVIIDHPKAVFAITLSLQLLGALIAGLMAAGGVNVFEFSKGESWSYRIDSSNITDRDDGWAAMVEDEPNTYWAKNLPTRKERSMNFVGEELEVIYSGRCFTPKNLRSMQKFEDGLLKKALQSGVCELHGNETCRPMKSILRLFDGTYEGAKDRNLVQAKSSDIGTGGKEQPTFRKDENFDRIIDITRAAYTMDGAVEGSTDLKILLEYTVGSGNFDEYSMEDSMWCRSKFFSGAPLAGYRNIRDQYTTQQAKTREMHSKHLKGYLEKNDKVGDLEAFYSSKGLEEDAFTNAHRDSFFFVIGSGLVVIIGTIALTRSPFLGAMLLIAQFGIFMWTNLVYRYMFGYRWLGLPQQLSLFAVFAVSMVHFLFLLHEFKTAHESSLKERLPRAVRGANKSVVLSSMLGATSYFTHCLSKIVVVESTGLFLGIAVLVSLFTYLVFYPAVIAFWFKYLKGEPDDDAVWVGGAKQPISNAVFDGAIGHKTARWFIAAGMFITLATFIIITVKQLQLNREQPVMWRGENNHAKFERASRDRFRHSESGHQAKLRIIWGLDHLEQKDCHKSNPSCLGQPIYDNLFDLSWHEPQNELIRFCDDLKSLDGGIVNDLKISRKPTGVYERPEQEERPTEIKCFMTSMRDFYKEADKEGRYKYTGADDHPCIFTNDDTCMFTNDDTCTFTNTTETCAILDTCPTMEVKCGEANPYDDSETCEACTTTEVKCGESGGNPAQDCAACTTAELKCGESGGNPERTCDACTTDYQQTQYAPHSPTNSTLPFSYNSMKSVMEANSGLFSEEAYKSAAFFAPYANPIDQPSCRNCDSYYRHMEVGMLNWVANDGDNSKPATDLEDYVGLVGGVADATMAFNDERDTLTYGGDYGSFLRYVAVEVNLTISSLDEDHDEALKVFQAWDTYVREYTTNLSKPLQHAFQTTPVDRTWAWLEMQKILVNEAIRGLILSIVIFGIVMTISLNNYAVGILATLAVGSVPVALVGMFTACQWNLGLSQCVLLVMPIGMTTDFVSHYAIWYTKPDGPKLHNRLDKARYAFQQSSFAVVGGGVLMFASSLFLLGSKLDFVFSFGVALSFTLGMAALVGMFLFLILLGIVGPEGDECTLFPCLKGSNAVSVEKDDVSEKGGDGPEAVTIDGAAHMSLDVTPPLAPQMDPLASVMAPPIRPAKDGSDSDSDSDSGSDSESDGENGPMSAPSTRLPALGNNPQRLMSMPPLAAPKSATASLPPLISPSGAE